MITTKERAILRSASNDFKDDVIIGKDGITEYVINQINESIFAKELIKIKVLKNSGLNIKQACIAVCEKINAEPVSVVGSKIVIYKRTTKKDFKHFL